MSEAQRAEIAARYSALASAYDELWSPIIRPMSAPLFDALAPFDARVLLDVGCGTGALAADARRAAPGAVVAGIDLAQGMVASAVSQGRELGVVAEASAIPFASRSVDAAFSVFVLQHVPDPQRAIAEMGRVVRPRGVGATVTWGAGKDSHAEDVLAGMLDAAGAVKLDIAVDTSEALDAANKAAAAWSAAGLRVERAWDQPIEHRWTAESLIGIVTGYGRSKTRFESLPAGARQTFVAEARSRIAEMSDDELTWRPVVVFAIARR